MVLGNWMARGPRAERPDLDKNRVRPSGIRYLKPMTISKPPEFEAAQQTLHGPGPICRSGFSARSP